VFERDTTVQFRVGATLDVATDTPVRTADGAPAVLAAGTRTVDPGTTLVFPAGAPVPEVHGKHPPGGSTWQRPLLDLQGAGHALFGTLAVLIATMLGTMGLPHVIVRFHTSPDGRAARRTAAITVALLGCFYLFPGVYGVLGRVVVPQLYLSGTTDTVVVALPGAVDGGPAGSFFTAVLTAGAFAACFATSLGLLLVVAGALSHDLAPGTLRRLRVTVFGAAAVVVLLALPAIRLDAGVLVTWGFTVAASTFCPLLVLGIWWSGLTRAGALAGVVVGLVATSAAIAATLFASPPGGWLAIVVAQPAPWSVPLAFATMVLVSLRGQPPSWSTAAMLRLHLPIR